MKGTSAGNNRTMPRIGIDVVAISRIQNLLEEYPQRFRDYAFAPEEQQYCDQQAYPSQHYAARWAVKEALIKSVEAEKKDTHIELSSVVLASDCSRQVCIKALPKELKKRVEIKDNEYDYINISMSHERYIDVAIGIVAMPQLRR